MKPRTIILKLRELKATIQSAKWMSADYPWQPLEGYYLDKNPEDPDDKLYFYGPDHLGWSFKESFKNLVMRDYLGRYRSVVRLNSDQTYQIMVDDSKRDCLYWPLELDIDSAMPGDTILLDDEAGVILSKDFNSLWVILDEEMIPQEISLEEAKTKKIQTLVHNTLRL